MSSRDDLATVTKGCRSNENKQTTEATTQLSI